MAGALCSRVFMGVGVVGTSSRVADEAATNAQQDDRRERLKQACDSSLRLSQDVPARLRATAEKIIPFVPRRVESAFLSGVFDHEFSGGAVPMPSPRRFQGAVLLVDISGFTKLSEYFSRLGTEGCEEFSTLVSSYLAIMSDVIASYNGDIDCFAGDALLVVFSCDVPTSEGQRPSSPSGEENGGPWDGNTLGAAIQQAFNCMTDICRELNGVKISPGSPALSIHGALAAGTLYAVECGDEESRRREAFVIGQPLCELGDAMPLAGKSELSIASSTLAHLGGLVMHEDGRVQSGCQCIQLPMASGSNHALEGLTCKASCSYDAGSTARAADRVARMAAALVNLEAEEAVKDGGTGGPVRRDISFGKSARSNKSDAADAASDASSEEELDLYPLGSERGLDSLLQFVPRFVQERCVEGVDMESLSDHRRVCVLFVVAHVQSEQVTDIGYIKKLQRVVGKVMHTVDTFGGVTRQVTVDDKGLAAIFVFGLPGSGHGNLTVRCLQASLHVTKMMHDAGVPGHAGVDYGPCYCGLVGNSSRRCEYTVMGDTVNMAARLSGKARKKAVYVLCSDRIRPAMSGGSAEGRSVRLAPAGSEQLKGRVEPMSVFVPELAKSRGSRSVEAAEMVGRADVLARLEAFAQSRLCPGRGPGLLVIEGGMGMGKSMVLNVMQHRIVPMCMQNKGTHMTVRLFRAVSGRPAFHMCHTLLESLLELNGVANAGFYSCLEAEHIQALQQGEGVPEMLRKFMPGIHDAHALASSEKIACFQEIYTRIFRAALASKPALLMILQADLVDSCSLATILRITEVDTHQGLPGRHHGDGQHACGGIVLATSQSLTSDSVSGLRGLHGDISHIVLQPLQRPEIEQLAHQALGCSAVRDDLLDVLTEQTQGVPAHVVELCQWMQDRSVLDTDKTGSSTGIRRGIATAEIKVPSLENIIRYSIDQLPWKQAMLLRIASILGMRFAPALYFELASSETQISQEDLMRHIEGLFNSGWLTDVGDAWQFEQQIAQHVSYSATLHRHRRRLHARAGEALRKKLEMKKKLVGNAQSMEMSELHESIAGHFWEAIKGRLTEKSEGRVTEAELMGFSTSAIWSMQCSMAFYGHGWQAQLKECIQAETYRPGEVGWIKLQLKIAQECSHWVLFDSLLLQQNVEQKSSTAFDDLQAIITLLTNQLQRYDEQGRAPALSESAKSSGKHGNNIQAIRTIGFCTPVAMQYAIKSYVSLKNWRKLCDGIENATSLDVRLVYIAVIIPLGMFGSRYQEIGMYAEEAYREFEAAGQPHVKVPFPTGVESCLKLGSYVPRLMQGDLDELEVAFRKEHLAKKWLMGPSSGSFDDGMGYFGMSRTAESSWEPRRSARVSAWHRRMTEWIIQHKGSKYALLKALDYVTDMDAAHSLSLQLADHAHRNSSGDPSMADNAGIKGTLASWVQTTSAAIHGIQKSAVRVDVQPMAVNLVHEGCHVVFPPSGSELECTDLYITDIAVNYLKEIVAALVRITQHWEENYIFEEEEFSRLPGTLIWAKTMLHWFQWLLWPSDKLSSKLVDDPRLKRGVRGWPRGPQLPPGPRCICSHLLLAQAVSTGDPRFPETLPGLLPATLGLARLLMGHGQLSSWPRFPGRSSVLWGQTTVRVPGESPQPAAMDAINTSSSIPVIKVELGSAAAAAVAAAHLRGVIRRIKIEGAMIDPEIVQTKRDVGSSETLWSAVLLYKAAKVKAAGA